MDSRAMQNQLRRRSVQGKRGEESMENSMCHVQGSDNSTSNKEKQLFFRTVLFNRH